MIRSKTGGKDEAVAKRRHLVKSTAHGRISDNFVYSFLSERSGADVFCGAGVVGLAASRAQGLTTYSRALLGDRSQPKRCTPRPTMNPHVVSMDAADLYSTL